MMIGPDPISRILWMSSRRGMCLRRGGDRADEAIEQMQRIVGARAGFGVVLDGCARNVLQCESLDGAVIQVDVGQLRRAERGLPSDRLVLVDRARAVRAEDREPMVLARD